MLTSEGLLYFEVHGTLLDLEIILLTLSLAVRRSLVSMEHLVIPVWLDYVPRSVRMWQRLALLFH